MICSSASWRSERRAQLLRDDCRAIAAPEWPAGAVAIARARHAGCCRLVRVATDACESRSPIRPTAHRICGRDSVLRPNLQKFFSPGSSPRKSSDDLVAALVRALHACADGAERFDDDVEKPLCHAAFLHSMQSNALARSWTRWLLDVSRRASNEAPEALADASRLSTIR